MDEAMMAAHERMALRGTADSVMANEGQQNAGGVRRVGSNAQVFYDSAPLLEYPRMMYRKTDVPEYAAPLDPINSASERALINSFDGLLCETIIVPNADAAETLTGDGWDVTPRSAHGLSDGMAKEVSEKDAEIAALRAQLAERDGNGEQDKPRRGRPPKSDSEG